jgi:tRNA modification GTPase
VTPLQARAAFDQLQGTLTTAIAAIDQQLFDLIARLEASVDFPEEGFHFIDPASVGAAIDDVVGAVRRLLGDARRGRLIREGLQIAIVGQPNVGKSSLFNALVGTERAIVTEIPGTTRDLVTETVDLEGLRATLIDTAGLRETTDIVETEGVKRSRRAVMVADLILLVADRSEPLSTDLEHDIALNTDSKRLIVANKSDLPAAWTCEEAVNVSATSGQGLDLLRRRIFEALDIDLTSERPAITNIRHIALLERAETALASARAAVDHHQSLSEEFILADLQEARAAFEEVTGHRSTEDLLAHIFGRFCIGK